MRPRRRASCRRPTRHRARGRCAGLFPCTFHVTRKCISPRRTPAQPVVAACGRWAKTWLSNWNSCQPASALSVMCAPSWHAPAATPSSRRWRQAGQWSAVSLVLLYWHISVAKFADHLPLYRQSSSTPEGVDFDRALLASWVGAASALLRPLVDAVRRHVLAASKLHADDTPDPGAGTGQRQDQNRTPVDLYA